jgi:hypothetical protein
LEISLVEEEIKSAMVVKWGRLSAEIAMKTALLSRHHLSCRPGVSVESKARPKQINKGAIPRPQGTDI